MSAPNVPTSKSPETRAQHATSPDKASLVLLKTIFSVNGLANLDGPTATEIVKQQAADLLAGNAASIVECLLFQATSLRWLFSVNSSHALNAPPEQRASRLDAALSFQNSEIRCLELVRDFLALNRQPTATPTAAPGPPVAMHRAA